MKIAIIKTTVLFLEIIIADTAGMIDGPNRYRYVRNIPTMLMDPTGMNTAALNPALVRAILITGTATILTYQLKINAAIAGSEFDYSETFDLITYLISGWSYWLRCPVVVAQGSSTAQADYEQAVANYDKCIKDKRPLNECFNVAADEYEAKGHDRSEFFEKWFNDRGRSTPGSEHG